MVGGFLILYSGGERISATDLQGAVMLVGCRWQLALWQGKSESALIDCGWTLSVHALLCGDVFVGRKLAFMMMGSGMHCYITEQTLL